MNAVETIRSFIENALKQHGCKVDSLGLEYFVQSWNELYGATHFNMLQDSIELLVFEFKRCCEFENVFKLNDIEELVDIIREEFLPHDNPKFIRQTAEMYSKTVENKQ